MKTKPPSFVPGPGQTQDHRDHKEKEHKDHRDTRERRGAQLNDKENSHGKFAGISPESVRCMSEQVSIESLSEEACAALAEDLSYKLRQLIHNVALHARHAKTTRVQVEDVNATLRLMDTQPILGAPNPQWMSLPGPENLCFPVDPEVDLAEVALRTHTFYTVPPPALSVSWISDSKSLANGTLISSTLQNYYTKMSKALLSNDKKLVAVALQDLRTNTRIGPVVPHFMNLAFLVLNEAPQDFFVVSISHQHLHRRALTILDCLFLNPCCPDTNIVAQLQRLFPLLVSNVITESILSDRFLRIIASIVTVWPCFAYIGRNTVLEYLSHSFQDRLTGSLVECLTSLGRKALVDGLAHQMQLLDSMTCRDNPLYRFDLREALLNASSVFLKVPNNKYDPKIAYIDEWLYEILADAIIPRRIYCSLPDRDEPSRPPTPETDFDSSPYSPPKQTNKKSKFRIIVHFPSQKDSMQFYDGAFEYNKKSLAVGSSPSRVHFNVAGCRQLQTRLRQNHGSQSPNAGAVQNGNRYGADKKTSVVVSNGSLLRFKYRLPGERRALPDYGLYTL